MKTESVLASGLLVAALCLCQMSQGTKLNADSEDVSLFNNYEESSAPEPVNMRRSCDYYYDTCYDYYYRSYYYNGSSAMSDFLWFLIILVCVPIYLCMRCFGCIKSNNGHSHTETSSHTVVYNDDGFKDCSTATQGATTTAVYYQQPGMVQPGMVQPGMAQPGMVTDPYQQQQQQQQMQYA